MTGESTPPLTGLSDDEAAARLREEGYNEMPRADRRTLLRIILEVFREPMFQLLIAAGIIYLVLGDLGEALMLLASAGLTVAISVVQEQRTEKVLEALRDLTSPRALVIRGGARKRIAGREVVRGDIVVLAEGDRVPADAVLLSASELQTDESLLTGESAPVRKVERTGSPPSAHPGGDDLPFVFSGTVVVRGHGIAEVYATGIRSEIGRIGKALRTIKTEPTLLHGQTRRIVQLFATVGFTVSAAVVLLYGFMRGDWLDGALSGITLAMSMLPEEIPLVLAVFMVMGAWRIAQHRVLTRRPVTIETLGAATVLCTDKTGTLTMNRMSIAEMDAGGETWKSGGDDLPERFHALLEFGILASQRDPFDPMEKAFLELGQKYLAGTEHLHGEWLLAHEYGLSPDLLAVSHVWKALDRAHYVIAAKGAPEAVADLCHLDSAELSRVRASAERMGVRGMRVLGVAKASYQGDAWPGTQHDFDFRFLGLVGLADPLRPGVREAVEECRGAGIEVAMITGDYPVTARAIAEQAGIAAAGGVISGNDLRQMAEDELGTRIGGARVFARIMPEQKLRLVEAFKARGAIVAMTGDGVNDAPSLKAAHIGIAMGSRGTDVAREASSLVLLDDDFGSIVTAIRLGRRIYDNLRKAMAFILAVHVPIAGLSLLPLPLGLPLVFTPVHIAFLELVIDPVCSIVFEAEPEERNVMRRRPRSPTAPVFSNGLIASSLLQGALILLLVGGFFITLLRSGVPEGDARAATFIALVAANFGLIVANRSFSASIVTALSRPNRAFWRMLLLTVAVLTAVLTIAPLRELFRFTLPRPEILVAAVTIGIVTLVVLELGKAAGRRFGRAPATRD